MKENKNKKKRNNSKLLIVLGISLLTILGGTLAYFTTSSTITNIFKTALYQTKVVETFEAPENWTPGTFTKKEIKVNNTGSISMAARVSFTEEWVSANGNKLPLEDSEGNRAAIIHFNEDWKKDSDGYYYYGSKDNKTVIKPKEITTSFISGVTFNENIKSSLKESISNDGKTITYESTGDGYDNAHYTLTINIDTIQYDQADNIW